MDSNQAKSTQFDIILAEMNNINNSHMRAITNRDPSPIKQIGTRFNQINVGKEDTDH